MTAPTPDALPLRWMLILLTALVFAVLVGVLTFAQVASWPGALLAALAAAGASVPVLHQLLSQR